MRFVICRLFVSSELIGDLRVMRVETGKFPSFFRVTRNRISRSDISERPADFAKATTAKERTEGQNNKRKKN